MFYLVTENPWVFYLLVIFLGLIIGSFLNVVIHRLPIMLEKTWREECAEFLGEKIPLYEQSISLAHPGSHCPKCLMKIRFWHNIPIISYCLLRGRCAYCQKPIPFRYLLVEIVTLFFSLIAAVQFGLSLEFIFVLFLIWFLIAMSFIDIEHQIIPDVLTISALWLGLLASCFNLFTNTHDAILGAILGYGFFFILNYLFKLIKHKDGLGHADFKLLAAAGAWLGWQLLPFVILTSSIMTLLIGGTFLFFKRQSKETPIPFGPFIAIALFLGMIWGFDATQAYLQWFGIAWSNV